MTSIDWQNYLLLASFNTHEVRLFDLKKTLEQYQTKQKQLLLEICQDEFCFKTSPFFRYPVDQVMFLADLVLMKDCENLGIFQCDLTLPFSRSEPYLK